MTLDTFNTVAFWMGMAILIWNAPLISRYLYTKIFCRGMSNMRTAPEIGLRAAEYIKADMAAKGNPAGYTVVDMGSAWGYMSCDLAKNLPGASVIGIDCDPGGVKFSQIMAKKKKLGNVRFIADNFDNFDIKQADTIIFYLPDYMMEPMGQRLKDQAKPGTLIISNRFQLLAGWEPDEVVQVETSFPRQGRLNIYRKK